MAFALWLTPGDIVWQFAPGLLFVGTLIEMPQQERARPLSALHTLWLLAGIVAFVGAIVLLNRWIPQDVGAPVIRVIRHPLLVVPLWAAVEILSYRRWKGGKDQRRSG